MKWFEKFSHFFTRPLLSDPIGLLLLFVLSSGVQIVDRSYGFVSYGLYIATFAFLELYGVLLLLFVSQKVYRFIKPFLILFFVLFFIIDLFCYSKFNCVISPDIAAIVLSTNFSEAKEFFSIYYNSNDFILSLFVILISAVLYYYSNKITINITFRKEVLLSSIIILLVFAIVRNKTVASAFWSGLWSFELDDIADLSSHYSYPEVKYPEDSVPSQIVVVIGESFTPSHSSLYGYSIPTNPLLSKMREEGLLYTYSHVTSPATHTIKSFKYLLNTNLKTSYGNKSWYEYLTLIEVLKQIEYSTLWLSNQHKFGIHDNVPSCYAMICDSAVFVREMKVQNKYDESLLRVDIPKVDNQAVFFHLMGQHGAYDLRYPQEYDVFCNSIYAQYPTEQIELRRTYDNATLYNDYVVSEIFRKFEQEDAICFYFPDHGQDFFEVDDDYCGHGRPGNPESVAVATRIPFMVYMSRKCQNLHPELVSQVIADEDTPMCTDAFIFY